VIRHAKMADFHVNHATARSLTPPPAASVHGPVPERPRGRALGIAYVVASGLCFGSMPLFARLAARDGVDTPTLLLLRFSTAAAVMWVLAAAKGARAPRGRPLATLLAMGAIGYAGQAFCYFTALTLASAGLVALLLYLYPALVALLARVVLHHPLTKAQLGAVALALAGSVLTVGRPGPGTSLGIAFGLAAAFIYSGYILVGSRLPRTVTPTASTAVVTSAAAVVYGAVVAAHGAHLPATPWGWVGVAGIAVVGTVLAIGFFLAGLERVGPVRASVYSAVEPAFTLLIAAVVLGEPANALRLAGGALIVGAVVLLARADSR
jgi:drug/metabolite transporter (DMT)-like permease